LSKSDGKEKVDRRRRDHSVLTLARAGQLELLTYGVAKMRDDDLSECALADVLERLEAGKIGHKAAMDWLDVESYRELVEIMHLNGRQMWGHREMIVTPETLALINQITVVPQRSKQT
jgi:hypothetical protein